MMYVILYNNDSSYVLTVVWFIAEPYLHYEWTDLVYNAREKLLCYLQEIRIPSNTTAYIVFGWCILGVDIYSIYTLQGDSLD